MNSFLSKIYWDNTLQAYLMAMAIVFGGMLLLRLFRNLVLASLKRISAKTEGPFDDFLVFVLERKVLPLLNLFALYLGLHSLTIPPTLDKFLMAGIKIAAVYFAARLLIASIQFALEQVVVKRSPEPGEHKKELRGVMIIVKMVLWALALVFLFDNLGYDVTAIITGLGIGGIAIALAAQTILGDLFSYFVIFFDRPFEVGDFITVDDKMGTIEHVGIKTTRIKSLTGEQLIVSNTNLTNSRIHNFKKMERRRVVLPLSVPYDTANHHLQAIPGMVKNIIEKTDQVTFDRAHFSGFGTYSLQFEVVYFVETNDMYVNMDTRQQISFSILEAFRKAGIEFAFPTQQVLVQQMPEIT